MRRVFPTFLAALLATLLAFPPAAASDLDTSSDDTADDSDLSTSPASPAEPVTIRIAAVGDVMMGTDFPESVLPPRDGAGIFDNVRSAWADADIVFGNLEGPLADGGTATKCRKMRAAKGMCFEFRTPTRYAAHLAKAGFNVMNLANNHSLDFGEEGAQSTLAALVDAGLQAVGGERVARFDIRGVRVAILGFSYSPVTPWSRSILDVEEAQTAVAAEKEESDIVIVSFHGGAEGEAALHVADVDEVFGKTPRGNVVRFARAVVDAGADLVLGHGPHVPRAIEIYEGKLIAYSLGNFLTYGRFNLRGPSGIGYVLRADLDADTGDFAGGRVVPVELIDRGIPVPDPAGKAIRLLRTLSADDLPDSGIAVADDGRIGERR